MKKLNTRLVRVDPHADCTGPHEIDRAKVSKFGEAMRLGNEFPPVRLVDYGASGYQIIDGHHRVEAAQVMEFSFDALVADGKEFEQLDIDLRERLSGKRADDIEFWVIPQPEDAR